MARRIATTAVLLLLLSTPLFETPAVAAQEKEKVVKAWTKVFDNGGVELQYKVTEKDAFEGGKLYYLVYRLINRNDAEVTVATDVSWDEWQEGIRPGWVKRSWKTTKGLGNRSDLKALETKEVERRFVGKKEPKEIDGTITPEIITKKKSEDDKNKELEDSKRKPADEQKVVEWTTHSSRNGVDFQYSLIEDKHKHSTVYYYNFRFVNNNQYEVRVAAEVTWEVWAPSKDGRGMWQAKTWDRKGIHKMLIDKQGNDDNYYMNSLNEGGTGSAPRSLKVVSFEVSKAK